MRFLVMLRVPPWILAVLVGLVLTGCSTSAVAGSGPTAASSAGGSTAASSPSVTVTSPSGSRPSPSPASPSPATTSATTAGSATPPATAADPRPLHLAVIGDSLAFGSFASTAEKSFRLRLVAALRRTGPVDLDTHFKLVNVDRLSLVRSLVQVPNGLDVAVVELGNNDARHGTPLPRFAQDYDQMLSLVQEHSPHVQLVCMGMWWGQHQSFAAGTAADYDAIVSRTCRAHGGAFVGVRDLYDTPGLRGPAGRQTYRGRSDDYHPNDAGHAALAARLLPAVRAAAARALAGS